MRALSTRNDAPTEASRPFDAGRDGFVMGEGGGVLVLEELEHARARGARIYAELVGYGMSSDAFHMTAPDETGRVAGQGHAQRHGPGRRRAGRDRLHQRPRHLHADAATSPRPGPSSIAFGDHAGAVAVSSSKSMIGHCLGASGGIEAIVAVMTIVTGQIHPTANLTDPDPDCDLDFVPAHGARAPTCASPRSNSFGFGGHNVTLLFRRFED